MKEKYWTPVMKDEDGDEHRYGIRIGKAVFLNVHSRLVNRQKTLDWLDGQTFSGEAKVYLGGDVSAYIWNIHLESADLIAETEEIDETFLQALREAKEDGFEYCVIETTDCGDEGHLEK